MARDLYGVRVRQGGRRMLRSLLLAVVTVLSASCVMDTLEDEDVGLAAQELCMSCGGNGLNKRWAWYWDGTLNPSSLGKYGLWNGDHSINPICAWWSGSQCMATDAWKNWLSDFGNGDGTHTKAGNFGYIVKVAACQGQ